MSDGKKAGSNAKGESIPKSGSEKVTGTASLSLTFSSQKSAQAAYGALLAEADFAHRGGSKVLLEGSTVRVEIRADDPVSLRASLNSYLRLMQIIKTIDTDIE